jgi:hypothetical protein
MEQVQNGHGERYAEYFSPFQWNYLPNAILEGHHGEIWVDQQDSPNLVVLILPKIKLYLLGGNPQHPAAIKYLKSLKGMTGFFVPSEAWVDLLKSLFAGRLWEMERFAFTSERLDRVHLRTLAAEIPDGYRLEKLDLSLTEQLAAEHSEFASDHLVNFDSPDDFIKRGFGWCGLQGEQIVSVATTFLICNQGIEIQINTREEHQGKGLGTAVAASLMLESLERGLNPNWDAANKKSGRLAEKLGCLPQGNYSMYLNMGSKFMVSLAEFGQKLKTKLGK